MVWVWDAIRVKADPPRRLYLEYTAARPAPDAGELAMLEAALARGEEAAATFTRRADAEAFARSFAGTVTESEPHE